MNDTYSRFQKLLNGLKLYGRTYSTKDTKLKFLRSLPKEWKPMIVSLRHSHEFKDYTLDKLYGVLRIYELEIQQDEEIEKGQRKDKSIALVAHDEDKVQNKSERAISSQQVCEEKEESSKGKLKMEGTEDLTQKELEEIDEHLALLSRRFSKLKFKRNPTLSRPPITFTKDGQSEKGLVDRSKFKCYNYGIAGHFSNECMKPKAEKKRATDGIDYKQKYYDLLRKKEKAFVSKERDWLLRMKIQMRRNSSTLPSWVKQMIKKQVLQPLRYLLLVSLFYLKMNVRLLLMKCQMNCIICTCLLNHQPRRILN